MKLVLNGIEYTYEIDNDYLMRDDNEIPVIINPDLDLNNPNRKSFIHKWDSNFPALRLNLGLFELAVQGMFYLPPELWKHVEVRITERTRTPYPYYLTHPLKCDNVELGGIDYYYIPGYELNVINSVGQVFQLNSYTLKKPYLGKGELLDDKGFYPFVRIDNPGKDTRRPVHVLLGRAILPLPDNYPEMTVDHENTNRYDFALTNLSWVTRSENTRRAVGFQESRNDNIPIVVKCIPDGTIKYWNSLSQFAEHLNVPAMNVINAFNKLNQTYRERWVIKRVDDSRDWEEITELKMNFKMIYAKSLINGEEFHSDSVDDLSKKLQCSKGVMYKAITQPAKTAISNGYVFKTDLTDYPPTDEYTLKIWERNMQPSTKVYELIDLVTKKIHVFYGTKEVVDFLGCNKRTVIMSAKRKGIIHKKYSIKQLN